MTIGSVPITLDLTGIERLLGEIGKQQTVTTITNPIVNSVSVAVADPNATTTLDGIEASDAASITVYGRSGRQLVTILANQTQAGLLAEYLVRPAPEYWFSSIEVLLNGIPAGNRDAVAELEIGDQIRVSKRFPNVANPVVQDLFVEGVEHDINLDRHVVRLYCSPASLYECFVLNYSELDNPTWGLSDLGSCAGNGFEVTSQDSLTVIEVGGELYWLADWKASGSVQFKQSTEVEYLVVAGGGAGGSSTAGGGEGGGGGGAGGMKTGTVTVNTSVQTITVGAGGVAVAGAWGGNGSASSIGSLVATTGGGGGGSDVNPSGGFGGRNGGSGGGATWRGTTPGTGVSGEGFAGGAGFGNPNYGQGGGGGKSAAGQAGTATKMGDGGAGAVSSITGTAVTYAGGGGAGGRARTGTTAAGTGGAGGGGNGKLNANGDPGTDGLGGGGGGNGQFGTLGGNGGSGRVILRWKVYAD